MNDLQYLLNALHNEPDAEGIYDVVMDSLEEANQERQYSFKNSVGMQMNLISSGVFMMGSEDGDSDEKPVRPVLISKSFYMSAYEVTQAEYLAIMGTNPSWFSKTGGGATVVNGMNTDRFPVEMVSWEDARKCAEQLTKIEQDLGLIPPGWKYDLPTEAEWEYACRAGTTTRYNCGDVLTAADANIRESNLNRTCEVGSYKPNNWGLYDMHGNVWEWCLDWYKSDFYQQRYNMLLEESKKTGIPIWPG